jgi:hypothetical protein
LFNIVTAATAGIGVAVLYAALFVATLLLVPADLLGIALRGTAGVAAQALLAWLAASIATLGGAGWRTGVPRERARGGLHVSAGYPGQHHRRAPGPGPSPRLAPAGLRM